MREYELTIPQQGIHELETFGGEIMTTIGGDFFIKGKLNEKVMTEALNMVVKYNDSYRLRFRDYGDRVVQYIEEYVPRKFRTVHFHTLEECKEWLVDYQKTEIKENDGLFEFIMVDLDDAYGVISRANHKINDDWGMFLYKKRIYYYYHCLLNNEPIEENPYSYLDYIEEEEKYLQSKYYAKDQEYWNKLIKQYSEPTKMVEATPKNLTINRKIYLAGEKLQSQVEQYCKENRVSEFALLLSAFSYLIDYRTKKEDSYILTTFASRTSESSKQAMGMYVNSVPIHTVANKEKTVHDYIRSIVVSILDAIRHRKYGYSAVLKEVYEHNRSEQLSDVYFSLLNTESYHEEDEISWDTFHSGVQVESLNLIARINQEKKLEFNYYYHVDSFEEWEIDIMNQDYCHILRSMMKDDSVALKEIVPYAKERLMQVLASYNNTTRAYPAESTIAELFEQQVMKTHDKDAVVFGTERLTYEELNEKANALAHKIKEYGSGPDSSVMIIAKRSLQMIVGMLAILKADAAYIPIDPLFPEERIEYILNETKPSLILTYGVETTEAMKKYQLMDLADETHYSYRKENIAHEATPDNLAYILYTSGTTGNPKGVMIPHQAVVNYCSNNDKNVLYGAIQQGYSKMACLTNCCFDIFVTETWLALLNGMTTYVADTDEQEDIEQFYRFMKRNQIEIMQATPSRIKLFMTEDEKNNGFEDLRYLLIGGEKVSESLVGALMKKTDATIVNVYGPSETTVWSSCTVITKEDVESKITIGQPISNTQIYIVSEDKLCGLGVQGEVCIAGDGVARGYFEKPELTSERFINNPFGEGRLYKTGDVGRLLPSGTIDFIGRKDNQVKIRGYRIELGEIENVLRNLEEVEDAIVIAKKNASEFMELHAYLIGNQELDIKAVQKELSTKLPEYMVPAYMMQIAEIPVTRNGKLDVKALPEIAMETQDEFVAPRSTIEFDLAEIFEEVLNLRKVSITDSFFELGGDSIKATLVVSKARMKGYCIKARDVLVMKTIEKIAEYIVENTRNQEEKEQKAVVKMGNAESDYAKIYPLTGVQQGILYQYQFEHTTGEYFMQSVMHSAENINPFYFLQAIQLLSRKHEVLKTKIIFGDDTNPCQVIAKDMEIECNLSHINSLDELEAIRMQDIERGFNLRKDSLMRVTLVSMNNENRYLIWSVHHIISDGWSNSLFFRDFNQLYQMLASGQSYPELKEQIKQEQETASTFSDYVSFLCSVDHTKSLEYWKSLLEDYEGNSEILSVRDVHSEDEFCKLATKVIDNELRGSLESLAEKLGVTLNMIFESALGVLLQRYAGSDDVVFGKVTSGRNGEIPNIEEITGIFINMIPVRVASAEGCTVRHLIEQVSKQHYASMQYSYTSLADIQSLTPQNRDLIKVLFAYENFYGNEEFAAREDYEFLNNREQTNYDLTATIRFTEVATIELMYNGKKYCEEDGELFVTRYYDILKQFTEDPDKKCKDIIPAITDMENNLVFDSYNVTSVAFPENTLHGLFIEQVKKTPDKTAVICDGEEITYQELYRKSCQVANYISAQGIPQQSNVAVSGEKKIGTIANMMGILFAQCSYVPLNPEYPKDRNDYIVESSTSRLLLSADSYETLGMSAYSQEWNPDAGSKENIAYTIYTSGSTGRPKGVVISHEGAVNTILDINQKFTITKDDCIIGLSAFSFDLSVYDVFGALSTGATLVIVKDQRDISEIKDILNKYHVTFWNSVPAIMSMFLENVDEAFSNISLRHVLFSGDWIPLHLPEDVEKVFRNAKVTSLGGATEGSIWSIYYPVTYIDDKWRSIPYGKPLANQQMYVLDENLNQCPLGFAGQIGIGGKGVAIEYANDTAKTAKAFQNHERYGRIYLTGDMGRMRADGNIEFLGRVDDQVKIRGFRIELGEIENVIRHLEDVNDVAVVAKDMQDGDKELVAYLVSNKPVEIGLIQQEVRKKLPEYMVPYYIMQIDAIPLSANGKLDKKSLPAPAIVEKEYVPPRDKAESLIVKIFEGILNRNTISVKDNFFLLGGHSLKATKLANELQKETGVKFTLKDIFELATPELLARKVKEATSDGFEEIPVVEQADIYEVSASQRRMYLLEQMSAGETSYHISGVLEIGGGLSLDRLQNALDQMVAREESLRTSFHMVDGEPVQKVEDKVSLKIAYSQQENMLAEEVLQEFVQPFDLSKAPLMRVKVVSTKNKNYMFWDMHHIISDGDSVLLMLHEMEQLYNGKTLSDKKLQYKDFSAWQNRRNLDSQKEYWKTVFEDGIPVLDLKTDYVRPQEQSFKGAVLKRRLAPELRGKLRNFAKKYQSTEFMVMLSAFAMTLSKYSRQDEVVIGTPVSGRTHVDTQDIMGLFVNTLALKFAVPENSSYEAFLADLKEKCLEAYDNQNYPFDELVEVLDIERDMSRNPIFDVMFIMENNQDIQMELGGMKAALVETKKKISKFDLTLSVVEDSDGLSVNVEYCTDLFTQESMEQMISHYITLVENLLEHPEKPLHAITMTGQEERERILEEFNHTAGEYDKKKTVVELFEEQVSLVPERVAVSCQGSCLTYQELNQKANQLANVLREEYGVKPNDFVAVVTERSLEMIIGIFAVIKAGGAYVPIDPKYPEDRIRYIIEDSQPKVTLLYHSSIKTTGEILDLSDERIWNGNADNPEPVNKADNILYVIYTSGTTGKPKGVMVEHTNLVSLLKPEGFQYDFNENDVWSLFHSHCFDFSVWEIFGSLLYGGKLVVVPREVVEDAYAFAQLLEDEKVTVLNQVPSSFYNLIMLTAHKAMPSLRYVIFGGEALNPRKLEQWMKNNKQCQVINMYGITETTVHVTYKKIDEEDIAKGQSNIGTAIPMLSVYVMNGDELCGIGVPGELCVTGGGVTRGYLNRPELTAQKFVTNPYTGERMYRSGDLVRWLPDGTLEYLGRIDEQVKIRGFRIELGEIESAMRKVEGVKEAVVIVRKMPEGDQVLNAYFVSDSTLDVRSIQQEINKMLPDYMVPGYMMQIDKLPVTSNGKLNRRLLPEIAAVSEDTYVAPQTELEKQIEAIFQEVLGITNVGLHNNFFAIGGHSLKAVFVVNKVESITGVHISLKDFFNHATVASLCQLIEGEQSQEGCKMEKAEVKPFYPMSSAQKRMYIVQDFDSVGTTYNILVILDINGIVDREQLRYAFQKLIDRHESLRTSFSIIDGQACQTIHAEVKANVEYEKSELASDQMDEKICNQFIQPFDLNTAPLMRIKVIETSDQHSILLFDAHHIITDGVSQHIIIDEIQHLYNGEELPEVTFQYKDYSEWMRKRDLEKQKEYWIDQFAGEINAITIPLDFPRPKMQRFEGKEVTTWIDKDMVKGIKLLASQESTTEYVILLSALFVLLNKYSGQEDIVIGTPVSGRTNYDTEHIIGMFVNTLAFQCQPSFPKTFTEFVGEVKETCLQGLDHQDYPFEELVEELDLERDSSRNPLFDILFTMNNQVQNTYHFGDMESKLMPMESTIAKFDITVQVNEYEEGYHVRFEYSQSLFKEQTIRYMMENYILLLRRVLEERTATIAQLNTVCTENEYKLIMNEFNDTDTEYPSDRTIVSLFEECVENYGEQLAVSFEETSLTYSELNAKANALANKLMNMGVEENDYVALIAERSIEVMIGMLAIVKAGAAYVPIDPRYPKDRIDYILGDCKPKVTLLYRVEVDVDGATIDLADSTLYAGDYENPVCSSDSSSQVYVIYTSGTTGQPKGVMVNHKNVIRLVRNTNYVELNCETIMLQIGAISFDASVFEIWGALLNGGQLCLANTDTLQSPPDMKEFVRKHHINTMLITTALLNQMVSYDSGIFSTVRYLLFGGEKASDEHVRAVKENPANQDVIFINAYGPTEATVISLVYRIGEDYPEKTPIGVPNSNGKAYILNANHELCSIGQKGELAVTGDGVACGYLNRPELTEEKFIDNPFGEGKMYLTGDLGRWMPDGNVEYLGRLDDQVKIRGFRIELGDIESAIQAIDSVKDITVIVTDTEVGTKELCAYYVADKTITPLEIQEQIRKQLPEYMVPKRMMQIETMPITRNGKIDKRKLPKITVVSTKEFRKPETEHEKIVCEVFAKVLGADKVGLDDNLFDLGGDSIKAIRIVARLREYGFEVSMKELFMFHNVQSLAASLSEPVTNVSYGQGDTIGTLQEKAVGNEIEKSYPLSPLQEGLYYLKMRDETSSQYVVQYVLEMSGAITTKIIADAFQLISLRYDALRTAFHNDENGKTIQVVLSEKYIECECREAMDLSEEEIEKIASEDVKRGFDFEKDTLMRAIILHVDTDKHIIIWTLHHIIIDGWSLDILKRTFYEYLVRLSEGESFDALKLSMEKERATKTEYSDYIEWIQSMPKANGEAYWKEYLLDYEETVDFKPYGGNPLLIKEENVITMQVDREVSEKIKETAEKLHVTHSVIFETCWGILLQQFSNTEDAVFGKVVSGRNARVVGVEDIVGLFINTIPKRIDCRENPRIDALLQQVNADSIKSSDYDYIPLTTTQSYSRQGSELIRCMYTFIAFGEEMTETEDKLTIKVKSQREQTNYNLSLKVTEDTTFRLIFRYNPGLYSEEFVQSIAKKYQDLIVQVVSEPEKHYQELSLISDKERDEVLHTFNQPFTPVREQDTIISTFQKVLDKYADKEAIIYKNQKVTYQELDTMSDCIANGLIKEGVQREEYVALLCDPGIPMIVAMLGIIKIGAAYVPIDPTYPEERISYILEDCKPSVVLTTYQDQSIPVKCLNIEDVIRQHEPEVPIDYEITCTNLAYLIYTSGTTGMPKGVAVEHSGVVNLSRFAQEKYQVTSEDRVLQLANYVFDASVKEIAITLLNGATLVIVPKDYVSDIEQFETYCSEHEVTAASLSPQFYLQTSNLKFRLIITGGSETNQEIMRRALQTGRYVNAYGPTEATVCATYYEASKDTGEVIPIGKPILNMQAYIMRGTGLCGVGIPGELCIAGVGIARYYLGRDELTKEKFVDNPFGPGRLYRTGDLARWLPDGNIDYMGRIDKQIKIRGFRIEPGEIENTIRKLPDITDAAITIGKAKNGEQILLAYVTGTRDINISEMKEELRKYLPAYMVPDFIMQIPSLPLTRSGKLDVERLPKVQQESQVEYVAPRNELEEQLCECMKDVLKVERLGIYDNIFDYGATSLTVINIVLQANKKGMAFTIQDVFDCQTIDSLGRYLQSSNTKDYMIENAEEYEKLNYLAKDNVVKKSHVKTASLVKDILITGATGFLGCHLIYELVRENYENIYCVIRGKDMEDARKRMEENYQFYFGNEQLADLSKVTVICGDIADKEIVEKLNWNVDCVIHAAADTRHFGDKSKMQQTNVTGTENMLQYAKKVGAQFAYISTSSVCGNVYADNEVDTFSETSFYVEQFFTSPYVQTKFEAEKKVLEAHEQGLDSYIIRVGNLTNRYSDGKTIRKIENNRFYSLIRGYLELGYYSERMEKSYVEFSPIDLTAKGVTILIKAHKKEETIYHLFNRNMVSMAFLLDAFKKQGYQLEKVEQDVLEEKIKDTLKDEKRKSIYDKIKREELPELEKPVKEVVALDTGFTDWILQQNGFYWEEVDVDYLQKVILEWDKEFQTVDKA